MSARSVPEWQGKTPDSAVPQRVRLRVFEREGGRCHRCRRKITAGERWTLEHVKALINGGENRERNLSVTCDWCLPAKNAEDVAEKAKTARVKARHLGVRKAKHPMPGSRASRFKRKIGSNQVVDRETGEPVNRRG